jgi:hypothetical protein
VLSYLLTDRQLRGNEMNIIKLPGFSADKSLYSGGRQYSMPHVNAERSSGGVEPQVAAGGGGGTTRTCADAYGDCYIGCSVDYPESGDSPNNLNADFRDTCFGSCDAGYNVCTSVSRSTRFSRLGAFQGARLVRG